MQLLPHFTSNHNLKRVWFWWWCYQTPYEGWRSGGTPRKPNSQAKSQGLDQK